ncbi:response regulator transcription factor [Enterococcus hulanensis]|uniref:response regulator transcription factor n=1 Tax=Enterococcus hulanensis TaxID=2559929 RepID=UPI0010F7F741|nr:response regulator transcription factor [Enterococcus hulanensis]
MRKLLIVEDENEINKLIHDFFELKGYEIKQAYSGTEALLLFDQFQFDAIILDLMLPGKDGEEVLRLLKAKRPIPVIIVSAKEREIATITTLKLGADDYVAKPFNLEELYLRTEKAIAMYGKMSAAIPSAQVLSFGEIELSEAERTVKITGKTINLTSKEFDILSLLIKAPNQVFTKEKILELVWQDEFEVDTNTVSVHVSNLRKKLGKSAGIKTIWGIGFKLEPPL